MTQRLRTDFERADDSPGLMLWRVTNSWQASQRAALKPLGLTHVQFILLASLTWLNSDDAVTQGDLARHARTDPMMTSQVLRALEAKALVERRTHPADSRARAVRVTEAGAALANDANAVVEAVDRQFFAPLEHECGNFTRLLGALSSRAPHQHAPADARR